MEHDNNTNNVTKGCQLECCTMEIDMNPTEIVSGGELEVDSCGGSSLVALRQRQWSGLRGVRL